MLFFDSDNLKGPVSTTVNIPGGVTSGQINREALLPAAGLLSGGARCARGRMMQNECAS